MARQFAPPFQKRPACTGPVAWKDWPAVERDIQNLKDAAARRAGADEVFMTSPSPGQIGRFLQNRYYPSDEEYLYTLADVMKREYQAIVEAGFVFQIDCPDLALGRHTQFAHLSLRGVPRGRRDARRGPQPRRGRACRPTGCACTSAGPAPAGRTIATCRSRTSPTSSIKARPGASRGRRRQSAPRARVEGVEGRDAARRQGAGRRRDRLHHELHRASRSWWPSASSATPRWWDARTSSPASIAASARSPGASRWTRTSCGTSSRALVEGAELASRALW